MSAGGSKFSAAFERPMTMTMASARWDDSASTGSWGRVECEAPQDGSSAHGSSA